MEKLEFYSGTKRVNLRGESILPQLCADCTGFAKNNVSKAAVHKMRGWVFCFIISYANPATLTTHIMRLQYIFLRTHNRRASQQAIHVTVRRDRCIINTVEIIVNLHCRELPLRNEITNRMLFR